MTSQYMTSEQVELLIDRKTAGIEARLAEIVTAQHLQGTKSDEVAESARWLRDAISGGPGGEGLDKAVMRNIETTRRIELACTRLEHAVLGNGQAGLAEQVRAHSRKWETASKLLWIAVTALAGAVVTLAFKVFD